jgi:hypothetical protein
MQWNLSGQAQASSSVTGLLGLHRPIAGAITASASVSGSLTKSKALVGAINALSTVQGDLTGTWHLAGDATGISSFTGDLHVTGLQSLAGAIGAVSTTAGALTPTWSLAGTTDTVSSMAGKIGVLWLLRNIMAIVGTATYAGPTGVIVAHNVGSSGYIAFLTSIDDSGAAVGEIYIDSIGPNSFTIHNSGHGQSDFDWSIPKDPYNKGNSVFAGSGGQTVPHTKGDTDYVPCIIPSADSGGALGEWWITDKANTSFVVRNSGSALTAFEWTIPRFDTGGKGASAFAGSGGVTITHNLGISGNYMPLIIPTANPNGCLGAVYVTDVTSNSFKVRNTGSAVTTFDWILYNAMGTLHAISDIQGTLRRIHFVEGTITGDSSIQGALIRTCSIEGTIASNSSLTGSLSFVAPTRGFYYSKLGTDNFINPPDTDFNVTVEHNGIASFDFVIQNNAANRTIITDHLTEDFKIMRDDGTEILTGSIDSDRIEYFAEGEGGAGKRIRLSGYASFIDLAYLIYKRMADADAEAVGSVQDEDNSMATFTDYTTAANNDTINDVLPTFGAVNDTLYVGKDETFFAAKLKYSTKGIQAANTTVVTEYSKGSGVWTTLDCIDESYAFTEDAGTYLFYMPNKPDDWTKDTINSTCAVQ